MVKDKQIQQEVQQAVREYVDQLISERRAPGRGMAVSAHDLMVAARSAGQRACKSEADQLLDAFAATGMQIIKETPRAPLQPKYNPNKRPEKKEPQRVRKKDYHWMAWPSPCPSPEPGPPSTPIPLSARPASQSKREFARQMIPPRPASAAAANRCATTSAAQQRPKSSAHPGTSVARAVTPRTSAKPVARVATPRAQTPRIPTPALPVPIAPPTPSLPPTPQPSVRAEGIEQMYRTPEPTIAELQHGLNERPISVLSYRSPTPQHNRVATPREFDPSYRDVMDPQVTSNIMPRPPSNHDPAYIPGLKAWVTNANDYEREVAFNLLQAVSNPGRAHSPYKGGKTRHVRMPTAGAQTTYSIWDQLKNASWDDQELVIAGKSLGQKPGADYYRYSKKGPRPGVARHTRQIIPPKEYTCETSFFMNSHRPFMRDFIINPEWASESNKMKRNLTMMTSTKGPKGLRYSSK